MKIDLIFAARLLALAIATAAVASCGGGGGGGGAPAAPVPTLALTTSNAQNVGGDALLASVQTPGKSDLFAPLSAGPAPVRKTLVLTRFLQDQLARVAPMPAAGLARVPDDVQVQPCAVSGNITIVSGTSSATETFNACSDLAGESVSGVVTIGNIAGDASSISASVSVSLTFSVTGFPDQSFSGSFGIAETGIGGSVVTTTISGANLTLHEGTNTEDLGFFSLSTTVDTSSSTTSVSVSFMYSSTEIGGTVAVTTLTPFQVAPGKTFPHTGALLITGVNRSAIKVTVNGDESAPAPQVTIQLDANGDGVFELTLNKNWADLTA